MEFELLSGTSSTTEFSQLLSWCQEGPRSQAVCSWFSLSRQWTDAGVWDLDGDASIIWGRHNRGPHSQMELITWKVTWTSKPETHVSLFS